MQSSKSNTKVASVVIAAVMALTAFFAASAAAEVVPAEFSAPEFKITTTGLTVKKNGLEPKSCTFKPTAKGITGEELFVILDNAEGDTKLLCPTIYTTLQMVLHGEARYDEVAKRYTLHVNDYRLTNLYSPWGSYWQESGNPEGGGFDGVWVNGSGATASTVTFTNQAFGYAAGQKLTIEGTAKVTTPSGGLITLSH